MLVKSVESIEKAGEEGDKYLTLTLLEYKGSSKRFVAVQTPAAVVKQEDTAAQPQENPAVTENKTHTVQSGDTLWGIAKKYYGNGAQYPKIASANNVANPNVIQVGQVLAIPS